ncbi:MAG: ATP-binding protein [Paludibacteraceae bacterium]|nr:ATP-binding protein [Paludibacteraceae bacterium]
MEELLLSFRDLIDRVDTRFVRYLHDEIDWNSRLIAIMGTRGVGKTTLLLQHIKLNDAVPSSLYVTADDLYFSRNTLVGLAQQFYQQGGKYLYIDEIHKYKGWSQEIKNIYDKFPELHVIYTGSSILDLEKGGADLSRRKIEYKLPGLSFREYVNISKRLNLPAYGLEDILAGKVQFPYKDLRPLQLFTQYLHEGYFPFFQEDHYNLRIQGIIKQTIETDIPIFAEMEIASVQKLRKLMYVLSQSVPFKPNYSKLSADLDIRRNTLPQYMLYLEKAGLISTLRGKAAGMKILEKVEKIYLQNPNFAYALSPNNADIGNIRETIFFAWLQERYFISSSKVADFEVEEYVFEVGGRKKRQAQIASVPQGKGFVVKDDVERAIGNIIPLWMFGFVY